MRYLWNVLVALAIVALALIWFCTPVYSQNAGACQSHDNIVNLLRDEFGEEKRSYALTADGLLMETFLSEETGTWTFTITDPNGLTCMVAAGDNWVWIDGIIPGIDG